MTLPKLAKNEIFVKVHYQLTIGTHRAKQKGRTIIASGSDGRDEGLVEQPCKLGEYLLF
jgi:hypothetical protein